MNLYGVHFTYNDIPSRKYNLIIANLSTERMTKISGEKSGHFVLNKALKSRYLVGDDYSDSYLAFEIEVVTCDDRAIEMNELREIENWLFTNSTFRPLFVDISDDPYGETYEVVYGDQKRLYLSCRFINAEKLEYNGGVIGFRCTLETDSTMLWQEPVSLLADLGEPIYSDVGGDYRLLLRGDVNFDGVVNGVDAQLTLQEYIRVITGKEPTFNHDQQLVADVDGDGKISAADAQRILQMYVSDLVLKPSDKEYIIVDINGEPTTIELNESTRLVTFLVDSDIDGYTYPTIKLGLGYDNEDPDNISVSITNLDDDPLRKMSFNGLSGNDTVVIDSATHRVNNNYYEKMNSKFFTRLVSGVNNILIEGKDVLSVTITWQNRRYL